MSGFLLDTNVISELIKPKPERLVITWIEATDEALLHLSVLTLGEIRRGVASLPHARRRAMLEAWIATNLRTRFHGRLLRIDEEVADRWGWLTAQAQKKEQCFRLSMVYWQPRLCSTISHLRLVTQAACLPSALRSLTLGRKLVKTSRGAESICHRRGPARKSDLRAQAQETR